MRRLAERGYYSLSFALGRLLRSARYSAVRIVREEGGVQVRKRRSSYAPLLVRLGELLVRILDTGVRVLPQREWEEREERLYAELYGGAVRVEDGALVLPVLEGETLARLLDDPAVDESSRMRAVRLAASALAEFHRIGFTHGDAMAENVVVDVVTGVARWFDFETEHGSDQSMEWRRADDVRALLASCLARTAPGAVGDTVRVLLDAYGDDAVARVMASSFRSVWRRPLAFHLGQGGLSLERFRAIDGVLRRRFGG